MLIKMSCIFTNTFIMVYKKMFIATLQFVRKTIYHDTYNVLYKCLRTSDMIFLTYHQPLHLKYRGSSRNSGGADVWQLERTLFTDWLL